MMHLTHPSDSSGNGAWNRLCDVVESSGIFDSEKRQPHSQCMVDTRIALRMTLRELLDRHDRTNIWLNGLAGVGKTSIAFTVAEEMKRANRLAATFFFSHKHAENVGNIVPTIAYQLALTFPRIRDDIARAVENDRMLLSSDKSRHDQIQELIVKPLHGLKFRQAPYVIIIDALDECDSAEEAARIVALFINALSGPDLPIIHLIFTSRPEAHIQSAMRPDVHEIPLTTRDNDTIQDVRLFLRASLENIRTSCPTVFGQPPEPWPSEGDFETLAFKADGLFVYAAMAINFISSTGHPQKRLDLLLRERSIVDADIDQIDYIDQLYQQIIATSESPVIHCQMLASIIHLYHPFSLVKLRDLFHDDLEILAATLEVFSSVILNPPGGIGNVEIYHASLRDFLRDPKRSEGYHVDDAHAHERLATRCLILMMRGARERPASTYAQCFWADHLSASRPSRKLRSILARFTKGPHLVSVQSTSLRIARETCLSVKWIRSLSDIAVAWRIAKAARRAELKERKRKQRTEGI